MQALRSGDPLSAAELREMLIRHIMVEPFEPLSAPTTACLIDAWVNVAAADGVLDVVDEAGALAIFDGHLPESIPRQHQIYPREVLIQVATALGAIE